MPKVEISNGELLDKMTILQIKQKNITDKDKLKNIDHEINLLQPMCAKLYEYNIHYSPQLMKLENLLFVTNSHLWDIEDNLRHIEKIGFGDPQLLEDFVELARGVYFTNDERSKIKREINELTNSNVVEEKSYEDY